MSDRFQVLVDVEILSGDVAEASASVRSWLIQEQIIRPTPDRECILSGKAGYPPGKRFDRAIVLPDHGTRFRTPNGVEFIEEHRCYMDPSGIVTMTCPDCGRGFDPDIVADFSSAFDAWLRNDLEQTHMECLNCKQAKPFPAWNFEPALASGHLGIQFWNWPLLRLTFIDMVRHHLGHHVVLVAGKL